MKDNANVGINQDIKNKTAFFVGDDRINKSSLASLKQRLDKVIDNLIKKDIVFFGCGGVARFDQLAAYAILNARKSNPQVKFILILPYKHQYTVFHGTDSQTYRYLVDNADKVVYVSERQSTNCMEKHSLHLIKHSCVCVAYVKLVHGDASRVAYLAQQNGLRGINIAEGRDVGF